MDKLNTAIITIAIAVLSGCSSIPADSNDPEHKLALQCDQGLDKAYAELDFAKANGFGGSWEYTKAASLLGAAKVQSGFGGYNGCIEKAASARAYILESRK